MRASARGRIALAGTIAGVTALLLGVAVLTTHRDDGTAGRSTAPGESAAVSSSRLQSDADSGTTPSVADDEKCDIAAVPTLSPTADQRSAEALRSNPASQAVLPGKPLSRADAIKTARQLASPAQQAFASSIEDPDLSKYPAAATLLTFATADRWMPGTSEDSLVAATRCVWMVTVKAPFRPRSTPENDSTIEFQSYTALFDEASGDYLGVSAGTETPDLISGRHVGTDN